MKKRYYPYIYGGIAGVMTFIAMFYICRHSFALTNTQSLVWGIIGAILVFVSSSYTEYAIAESDTPRSYDVLLVAVGDGINYGDSNALKLTLRTKLHFMVNGDNEIDFVGNGSDSYALYSGDTLLIDNIESGAATRQIAALEPAVVRKNGAVCNNGHGPLRHTLEYKRKLHAGPNPRPVERRPYDDATCHQY